jgi:hypothetical protein
MFARLTPGLAGLATIFVLLIPVAGCNDNDTTISAPVVADVSLELVPTEGATAVSTDDNHDWMVSMELILTESGGQVGLDLNEVSAELVEAQNGISLGSQDGDRWRLVLNDPGDRIEAGETLTLDVDVFYTFESGGRESLIAITVVVTDDNGTVLVGGEQFHGLP